MWEVLTSNLQHSCFHRFPDTQTLEQSAEEYTAEHVGHFLEEIGLSHHVASFIEQDIDGDFLLEATDETLQALGVKSVAEKLKIKVFMGGSVCCDIASKGVQMAYGIPGGMPPFFLQKDVFRFQEGLACHVVIMPKRGCKWHITVW